MKHWAVDVAWQRLGNWGCWELIGFSHRRAMEEDHYTIVHDEAGCICCIMTPQSSIHMNPYQSISIQPLQQSKPHLVTEGRESRPFRCPLDLGGHCMCLVAPLGFAASLGRKRLLADGWLQCFRSDEVWVNIANSCLIRGGVHGCKIYRVMMRKESRNTRSRPDRAIKCKIHGY